MSADTVSTSKMKINSGLSIITELESLDDETTVSSKQSEETSMVSKRRDKVGGISARRKNLRKTVLTGKTSFQAEEENRLEEMRLKKIELKRQSRLSHEAAIDTHEDVDASSEDHLSPSVGGPSETKTVMAHSSEQTHKIMRDKILELEESYKKEVKQETTYQRYAREKMEKKQAMLKAESEARRKAKEEKKAAIWIPRVGDRCLARYKAREEYLPCKIIAITKENPAVETKRQSLFGTPKSQSSAPSTPASVDPSLEVSQPTRRRQSLFGGSSKPRSSALSPAAAPTDIASQETSAIAKSSSTLQSTEPLSPVSSLKPSTPKDRHAEYSFPSPKATSAVSPMSRALSPKSTATNSVPPSPSGSVQTAVTEASDAQEAALLRFTVHYDRIAEHHVRGRKKKVEGLDEIEEGVRLDLLAPPRNPHHYIKPIVKDMKLSLADQHAAHNAKMEIMRKNRELVEKGPENAIRRNREVAKKVWLVEQGPEKVRIMELKKKWRETGQANQKERRGLQHLAAFRYWGQEEQYSWIYNALLTSFKSLYTILEAKKNKKQKLDAHGQDYLNILSTAFFPAEDKILDKVGRKMSEVKYRDSRLIKDKDIQRAKNRPLSKVEEYMASTKAAFADKRPNTSSPSPPRNGVGSPKSRGDVMTASTNRRSEPETTRTDRASSPSPTVRGRSSLDLDNIGSSEYAQKHHKPPSQILEELRREYEVEMNRVFTYFAERLADHFGKAKRRNTNKMLVKAIDFCVIASHETINNSKFLRILPQKHKELKLLELRSQNMAKQYDHLYVACTQFAAEIGLVDKGWGRHLAVMLSRSILEKYDNEEHLRERGRSIAANRISSVFQMNRMRKILRSVYAQLDVLEQEAIQRNAIKRAEQEERERKEREEEERKAALAERRKIVGDGAVVYVAEDSLTALLQHRPVREFKNTRPTSPSHSRPSTSYEVESADNLPFYRMDVNLCFSPNGLALKLDGNIKIRCIVLREPTRRQTRSLPKGERQKNAKWGGARLKGAGTIGRSLHTPHTADVNHPHYHHHLDGEPSKNKRERGVRRTVYKSGRLLLLMTPAEWNMPDYGFQEILVHETWHKRSHGGAAAHLANSHDPNSNPELVAMSEEKTARMCHVTVELKNLPRDMEYRLHCMIHSTLISQEPWPPIPKYKLRLHEEPAVYSFLSAPAIPVMQNAQRPFLVDKNRVSQLTDEKDVLDMFARLQRQKEKEEEILNEVDFGVDYNEADGNSADERGVCDMESINDQTVYSTDDEMTREAITSEKSLRKWQHQQQQQLDEKTTSDDKSLAAEEDREPSNDEADLGSPKSDICQVDDIFDEKKECTTTGQGKGKDFLVSFRTAPTHPDRPRMKPPDVKQEMGGIGLDRAFIPSSSSKSAEHFIIARILWSLGYTGGLPVDEFELYRRIDTIEDRKQSSSSSSSVASSSSSLVSSAASSFVNAASSVPWELISHGQESNHMEMLPVTSFYPLMEQQVQLQEEIGTKAATFIKKENEGDQENKCVDDEEEDEFSVDKLKEMELEGIRVVEVPRTRFVSKFDKNKIIHAQKVPYVRLQYKARARNRCGWGYFSQPITFLVMPQREEFSIDHMSQHGLGGGLVEEVKEHLRALSRGGARTINEDQVSHIGGEEYEIDYSEMLSRPPTARIEGRDTDANDSDDSDDIVCERGEGEATENKEDESEFDFEKFLAKMAKVTPLAKLESPVVMP